KLKFFIKRSDFSLCPLWDLKDFFKILIWVIFWMQVFSVSDDIFGWLTGTTNERLFILLSFISSFALDIAVAVLIVYWLKKKHKQTLSALGIKVRRVLHDFKLGFLSYMSFLPVIFIVFMLSAAYFQKYDSGGSGQLVFYFLIFEKNPYILAAVSLFVAVIGPFVEELFFRGLLYGSLKKSIGVFQAALVSSLVFSMLHMNLIGLLPILSLAILLVYLYEKTGSFWVPFFVHVLHNSFILAVVLLWRRQIGI
ncbi:MAG: type II CAAX endopeptidase family protein, partial [Candidatus Omnitrophica bacterium]|nr:type II CAAX endopeptidase family protein [Candidatus Omnitrophota bacterium]